jgi:hypothetical protein
MNDSLESRLQDRLRVQTAPEDLKHLSSLKRKMIITRRESAKAGKLRERNGVVLEEVERKEWSCIGGS